MLSPAITVQPELEFAADVRNGLSKPQKELLSKYLYDDIGSALFEVISVLPEYGLTRADERVLQRNAYDIVERLPLPLTVAELGDIDSLSIVGFEREYLDGLGEVAARRRKGQHVLVLFLGSTIGNFDRPAG